MPNDELSEVAYPDAHLHIGGRPTIPDHLRRKRRIVWLTDDEWKVAQPILENLKSVRPPIPAKPRPQDAFEKKRRKKPNA